MASTVENDNGEMIVKRVSVPIGLEELMEGLTKEVMLKKPKDIYVFASEYFAHLLRLRQHGTFKGVTVKRAQSVSQQYRKETMQKYIDKKSKSVDATIGNKHHVKRTSDNDETDLKKTLSVKKIEALHATRENGQNSNNKSKGFLDKHKARRTSTESPNKISKEAMSKDSTPRSMSSDKSSEKKSIKGARDRSISGNNRKIIPSKTEDENSPRQKSQGPTSRNTKAGGNKEESKSKRVQKSKSQDVKSGLVAPLVKVATPIALEQMMNCEAQKKNEGGLQRRQDEDQIDPKQEVEEIAKLSPVQENPITNEAKNGIPDDGECIIGCSLQAGGAVDLKQKIEVKIEDNFKSEEMKNRGILDVNDEYGNSKLANEGTESPTDHGEMIKEIPDNVDDFIHELDDGTNTATVEQPAVKTEEIEKSYDETDKLKGNVTLESTTSQNTSTDEKRIITGEKVEESIRRDEQKTDEVISEAKSKITEDHIATSEINKAGENITLDLETKDTSAVGTLRNQLKKSSPTEPNESIPNVDVLAEQKTKSVNEVEKVISRDDENAKNDFLLPKEEFPKSDDKETDIMVKSSTNKMKEIEENLEVAAKRKVEAEAVVTGEDHEEGLITDRDNWNSNAKELHDDNSNAVVLENLGNSKKDDVSKMKQEKEEMKTHEAYKIQSEFVVDHANEEKDHITGTGQVASGQNDKTEKTIDDIENRKRDFNSGNDEKIERHQIDDNKIESSSRRDDVVTVITSKNNDQANTVEFHKGIEEVPKENLEIIVDDDFAKKKGAEDQKKDEQQTGNAREESFTDSDSTEKCTENKFGHANENSEISANNDAADQIEINEEKQKNLDGKTEDETSTGEITIPTDIILSEKTADLTKDLDSNLEKSKTPLVEKTLKAAIPTAAVTGIVQAIESKTSSTKEQIKIKTTKTRSSSHDQLKTKTALANKEAKEKIKANRVKSVDFTSKPLAKTKSKTKISPNANAENPTDSKSAKTQNEIKTKNSPRDNEKTATRSKRSTSVDVANKESKTNNDDEAFKSQSNFDASKLKEELKHAEEQGKKTDFKSNFNLLVLRQEIKKASGQNEDAANGSHAIGAIGPIAAALKIQSMWRGFLVRRSKSGNMVQTTDKGNGSKNSPKEEDIEEKLPPQKNEDVAKSVENGEQGSKADLKVSIDNQTPREVVKPHPSEKDSAGTENIILKTQSENIEKTTTEIGRVLDTNSQKPAEKNEITQSKIEIKILGELDETDVASQRDEFVEDPSSEETIKKHIQDGTLEDLKENPKVDSDKCTIGHSPDVTVKEKDDNNGDGDDNVNKNSVVKVSDEKHQIWEGIEEMSQGGARNSLLGEGGNKEVNKDVEKQTSALNLSGKKSDLGDGVEEIIENEPKINLSAKDHKDEENQNAVMNEKSSTGKDLEKMDPKKTKIDSSEEEKKKQDATNENSEVKASGEESNTEKDLNEMTQSETKINFSDKDNKKEEANENSYLDLSNKIDNTREDFDEIRQGENKLDLSGKDHRKDEDQDGANGNLAIEKEEELKAATQKVSISHSEQANEKKDVKSSDEQKNIGKDLKQDEVRVDSPDQLSGGEEMKDASNNISTVDFSDGTNRKRTEDRIQIDILGTGNKENEHQDVADKKIEIGEKLNGVSEKSENYLPSQDNNEKEEVQSADFSVNSSKKINVVTQEVRADPSGNRNEKGKDELLEIGGTVVASSNKRIKVEENFNEVTGNKNGMEIADAVLKIQTIWRGFNVRTMKKRGELFGKTINSNSDVKKAVENLKIFEKCSTEDNNSSASKIQAIWRGYKVRQNIKDVNMKLAEMQKPQQCDEMPGQRGPTNDDIMKAATKIQAGARGYMVRRKNNKNKLKSIEEESAKSENKLTDDEIVEAIRILDGVPMESPRKILEKAETVDEPEMIKKIVKVSTIDSASEKLIANSMDESGQDGHNNLNENTEVNNNVTTVEEEIKEAIKTISSCVPEETKKTLINSVNEKTLQSNGDDNKKGFTTCTPDTELFNNEHPNDASERELNGCISSGTEINDGSGNDNYETAPTRPVTIDVQIQETDFNINRLNTRTNALESHDSKENKQTEDPINDDDHSSKNKNSSKPISVCTEKEKSFSGKNDLLSMNKPQDSSGKNNENRSSDQDNDGVADSNNKNDDVDDKENKRPLSLESTTSGDSAVTVVHNNDTKNEELSQESTIPLVQTEAEIEKISINDFLNNEKDDVFRDDIKRLNNFDLPKAEIPSRKSEESVAQQSCSVEEIKSKIETDKKDEAKISEPTIESKDVDDVNRSGKESIESILDASMTEKEDIIHENKQLEKGEEVMKNSFLDEGLKEKDSNFAKQAKSIPSLEKDIMDRSNEPEESRSKEDLLVHSGNLSDHADNITKQNDMEIVKQNYPVVGTFPEKLQSFPINNAEPEPSSDKFDLAKLRKEIEATITVTETFANVDELENIENEIAKSDEPDVILVEKEIENLDKSIHLVDEEIDQVLRNLIKDDPKSSPTEERAIPLINDVDGKLNQNNSSGDNQNYQSNAATVIQSSFRSYRVRRDLQPQSSISVSKSIGIPLRELSDINEEDVDVKSSSTGSLEDLQLDSSNSKSFIEDPSKLFKVNEMQTDGKQETHMKDVLNTVVQVCAGGVKKDSTISLVHTGEFHDTITVPLPVTPPSSAPSQGSDESPQISTQQHPGELSDNVRPVSVQLNQAPPAGAAFLTSSKSDDAGDGDNGGQQKIAAQASDKDASTTCGTVKPADNKTPGSSMESEKRNNATVPKKNMEIEAATKIQAGFRGYKVRKQLKDKIGASRDNNNQRRSSGRRKNPGRINNESGRVIKRSKNGPTSEIEEKSAVKIQAGIRGFLVRRRQKKANISKDTS